jgi:hypothetical protein
MRNIRQYSVWTLVLVLSVFAACKKDEDVKPAEVDTGCVGTKVKYGPTAGTAIVTEEYLYNASRHVTRINSFDKVTGDLIGYSSFTYNGAGKLFKQTMHSASGQLDFQATYEYNAAEHLNKQQDYDVDGSGTATASGFSTFEYNSSNQVSKINHFSSSNPGQISEYETLEYSAAGNVTAVNSYRTPPGGTAPVLESITEYKYDNKKNPLYNIGYPPVDGPYISKNNFTEVTVKNKNGVVEFSYALTHVYNEQGYPSQVTGLGESKSIFLEYQCQ